MDTVLLVGAEAYNFDSYSVMSNGKGKPETEPAAECGCGHALVVSNK